MNVGDLSPRSHDDSEQYMYPVRLCPQTRIRFYSSSLVLPPSLPVYLNAWWWHRRDRSTGDDSSRIRSTAQSALLFSQKLCQGICVMGRCYLSPSLSIDAPSQNLVTKARPTYSLYYSGCYIPCMHIDETKPQYYLRSTTGKLGSPRLGRLNKIRISRHNHYGADQSRLMGIFMPFVFVSILSLFLFSGGRAANSYSDFHSTFCPNPSFATSVRPRCRATCLPPLP